MTHPEKKRELPGTISTVYRSIHNFNACALIHKASISYNAVPHYSNILGKHLSEYLVSFTKFVNCARCNKVHFICHFTSPINPFFWSKLQDRVSSCCQLEASKCLSWMYCKFDTCTSLRRTLTESKNLSPHPLNNWMWSKFSLQQWSQIKCVWSNEHLFRCKDQTCTCMLQLPRIGCVTLNCKYQAGGDLDDDGTYGRGVRPEGDQITFNLISSCHL